MARDNGTLATIEERDELMTNNTDDGGDIIFGNSTHGRKVCGISCFNVRRVTIIVNIASILGLFVNFIVDVRTPYYIGDGEPEPIILSIRIHFLLFIFIIEVFLRILIVYGAMMFQSSKVFIGFIVFSIDIMINFITLNYIGAIVNGLFLYPHYFLYDEIESGIMTKENYYHYHHRNDKQFCCCC